MNKPANNSQEPRAYRPKMLLYHANARGTGSALKMEMLPATGEEEGCIMLAVADQCAVGDRRAATPTYSRFDWDNRTIVKLGFTDLCHMLQVFRGECESIGDGQGLVHRAKCGLTRITLRHLVEPIAGYSLELYRTSNDGKDESNARIILSDAEALGLGLAIENSFGVISFGIPMLVEHDTTAYRREAREARNAAAA